MFAGVLDHSAALGRQLACCRAARRGSHSTLLIRSAGFYFVADDLVLATEFKDKDVIFNAYDPGRAARCGVNSFACGTATRVPAA